MTQRGAARAAPPFARRRPQERAGFAERFEVGAASGGPFFSVLPEKNGEKRGAGLRLVRAAGAIQGSTNYLVSANTPSHPTGVLVRAACYGTPDL